MLHRDIEMNNLRITGADNEWHPKHIDIVASLYICALILTWVCAAKMFHVGPLIFNASLFIYPLNHIFGDILTEIYGFNRTRRLIWMGLICGLLFLFFTQLSIMLPPPVSYKNQEAFALINGALPRIVIASYLAYLCCEFTNSLIISRLKIFQNAKHFPIRAAASTAGAQLVDSIIFFGLAFAGTMSTNDLILLTFDGWIAKVLYEIIMLPLTTIVVRHIKAWEGIEHFDHYKLHVFKF
jgi:queuosine precursor transporter